MICKAKNPSTTLRIGLVLFDEARTRVFALRGTGIEDAREYTVDVHKLKSTRCAELAKLRPLGSIRIRERAAHTARVVRALHDDHPFDCLLVAGPPWAQLLVRQQLPAYLRPRLIGSLTLSVAAGESAILAATLPVVQAIARRTHATQHRAVVVGSQRSRFAGARQFMDMLGGPAWQATHGIGEGSSPVAPLGVNSPARL